MSSDQRNYLAETGWLMINRENHGDVHVIAKVHYDRVVKERDKLKEEVKRLMPIAMERDQYARGAYDLKDQLERYKQMDWANTERECAEVNRLKVELEAVKTGKGIANPYLVKDQKIKELEAEVKRLKHERTKVSARGNIAYLWFSGKDGWQVTSFHPKDDPAIGYKESKMYVNYDAFLELQILVENFRWLLETIAFSNSQHADTRIPAEFVDKIRQALTGSARSALEGGKE